MPAVVIGPTVAIIGLSLAGNAVGDLQKTANAEQYDNYEAMKIALDCVKILAKRYKEIADEKLLCAQGDRKEQLTLLSETLAKVPENGAETLYEAIQSFILLWQIMC